MFTRCIKFMIMTPKELMIHFEVSRPFWSLVHAVATTKVQADEKICVQQWDLFSGVQTKHISKSFWGRLSDLFKYRLLYWEGFPSLWHHFGLGGAIPTSPSLSPMASETGSPTVAQPDEPSSTRLGHVARWCIKEASGKVMRWIEVSQKIMFQTEVCLRLSFVFPILALSANMYYLDPYHLKTTQFDQYEYFTVNMYTYIYLHMFWWFWCEWLNHHLVTLEIWRLKDQFLFGAPISR